MRLIKLSVIALLLMSGAAVGASQDLQIAEAPNDGQSEIATPPAPPSPTVPPSQRTGASLGINFVTLPQQAADMLQRPDLKGIAVIRVNPGSVGERAGLNPGDVVYQYDGKAVANINDMMNFVVVTPLGKSVVMKIIRGPQDISLTAKF